MATFWICQTFQQHDCFAAQPWTWFREIPLDRWMAPPITCKTRSECPTGENCTIVEIVLILCSIWSQSDMPQLAWALAAGGGWRHISPDKTTKHANRDPSVRQEKIVRLWKLFSYLAFGYLTFNTVVVNGHRTLRSRESSIHHFGHRNICGKVFIIVKYHQYATVCDPQYKMVWQ